MLNARDLRMLRDVAVRAVNECHDILAAAQKRELSLPMPKGQRAGRSDVPARPVIGTETPAAPAAPKLLFSVGEVASALGVSKSTVWRLRAEGQLQVFKLGGRTLFTAESLLGLLSADQGAAGLPRGAQE